MSRYGSAIVAAGFGLVVLAGAAACSSSGGTDAAGSAPAAAVQTTDPAGDNYSYPADLVPSNSAAPTHPIDGASYNNAGEIEATLTRSQQECSLGEAPTLSDFPGATDAVQCSSPGSTQQDTQIAVFKNQGAAQTYAAQAVVSVLWGIPGDTTALAGPNWVLTTTSDTYAQAAQQVLGGVITLPQDAPSPTPAATPAPEQVTFHCTGHGGVDITYGPNGSSHSASRLPFKRVVPLDAGALYYAVSAQLQGGGDVSCTTTVQTDDLLGYAQTVSNSGSADGGYNIASAEVCSGIDGWEKC